MYSDPILEKYIELIKDHNGDIKSYYQGEPIRIANSMLPCLIISKTATNAGPLSNSQDGHEIGLRITIITDVRKDLSSEESDTEIVKGVASLYDLMEGRNADYSLKSTSILDILRSNIEVDIGNNLRTDLGSITRVDYGSTFRDRAPEQWTIEARVDFTCDFLQIR
jgi:hypothetical protein